MYSKNIRTAQLPTATQLTDMLFCLLAAFLMVGFLPVSAASTASVTATVTVKNISVTVSDGTIAYGTLGFSTSNDTTAGNLNDSQTATNNGNVSQDFNIRGQDSADWTLAAAAGADQYRHRFCTSDCDGTPTWTALTTSYATLASGIAAAGTQVFDLEITSPSSSTSYDQQSVDVTVQAVEAS